MCIFAENILSIFFVSLKKLHPCYVTCEDLFPGPIVESTRYNKSESSFSCCHIAVNREILGITDFNQLETILFVLDTSSHSMYFVVIARQPNKSAKVKVIQTVSVK